MSVSLTEFNPWSTLKTWGVHTPVMSVPLQESEAKPWVYIAEREGGRKRGRLNVRGKDQHLSEVVTDLLMGASVPTKHLFIPIHMPLVNNHSIRCHCPVFLCLTVSTPCHLLGHLIKMLPLQKNFSLPCKRWPHHL